MACLIQSADDIDWSTITASHIVGLSAGASAQECLVDKVVAAFGGRYGVHLGELL